MHNLTVDIFQNIFEHDLKLLSNPICDKCDATIKKPLLPWIVGSRYAATKEKILFIGKPHRGVPGEELPSGILDPREPHLDWLMNCSWPYWSYTREILSEIYGRDDPWDYCCFSNIIKCTNVKGSGEDATFDKTSFCMAKCCIKDLGVVFKEIQLLQPHHIIFYTYNLFKDLLNDFPNFDSVVHVTSPDYYITCGQKNLFWWERLMKTEWYDKVKVLVVGHPERMKKIDYVKKIVGWINQ